MGYVDSNGLKLLKQQIENMIEAVNEASIISVNSSNTGIDLTVENGVLSADLKLGSGLSTNDDNEVVISKAVAKVTENTQGNDGALGGVIPDGVTITMDGNGVISANVDTYTLPAAGTNTLGGLYASFDSSIGTLTLSQEPITGSTTS